MSAPQVFVGIDVAKAQLDIALRPTGERWAVTNDEPGIAALVAWLQAAQPTLIVLEATGGHHRAVVAALAAAALPLVVMNPRQVRDFAKATGQLAKTDVLDARAVAHFAEAVRPLRCARCQTRRRKSCARSWRGGGNSSRCGPPSRTAWKTHRVACGPTSRPILPGSISAWRLWITTWTPRCGRVPSGASASPCTAVSPALGRCVHGRWCSTSGVGHFKPPAHRCPGRSRSVQSGQWHAAGDPHDLGWARACAGDPVHEYPRGSPL